MSSGADRESFNQIGDSLADSVGVPKKLDPDLIIPAPTDNGDFDGKGRCCFRCRNVQREVISRCQRNGALYAAACRREVEKYCLTWATVRVDIGWVVHRNSWAASDLHLNLTVSAFIGMAMENLKASL